MPSRNPAFSRGFGNAGPGQQSAGWGNAPQYGGPRYGAPQYGAPTQYGAPAPQHDAYTAPSPYGTTEATRYMTMDDVVQKTGLSFLVTVVSAAVTWALLPQELAWGLALPSVLVAFVLGLVIAFKQIANPAATLAYGALYGVALGAISEAFNDVYPGIVMQALIGTFGVFAGMLVVYKTGAIRVTPKLTRWVMAAGIGVLVLMVANFVAAWIGGGNGLGLRDGGPLAIGFSLLVIGVAAFFLLLDFDMADEAIRRGAPAKFAWYIAFGLLVTVIWLYIEILRLLSYLQDD
ncbi:Bax inhibitor-1/YccA family protein [Blastococcus sp. HT6-30]|uniref:Bax inhibitor-1/YccA family protein n=1 Tax=Blastococcus sp. HT6-30 TaxID=3144843 RepID=UPI00321A0CD9